MSDGALILIADDDRAIRTVLVQALARAGFQTRSTGTASTLYRWIEDGEGDAVITDVMMPDGDALDMLPAMRRRRPELPFIVMSAQNTVMTAIRALDRSLAGNAGSLPSDGSADEHGSYRYDYGRVRHGEGTRCPRIA